MPLVGAYCASKFALEAAADALRMELRPWHIGVAIVEPAQTDTDMWRTADDMVKETEADADSRAARLVRQTHRGLQEGDPGCRRSWPSPPTKVSAVVEEALTARRPRARYVVGVSPSCRWPC